MSILIAESLEKKYRSRKVVNNLSLNVKSGEIIGLLGPNGAGKTTAFYMMVGLVSCNCLLYTSPSPRDRTRSRMPSSA